MAEIEQEERQTYFQARSREFGFNGLSLLHRLNPLYQFNILNDCVFDAMHLLPLNVVKNHFSKLLSGEVMDERELACKLKQLTINLRDSQMIWNVLDIGRQKSTKNLLSRPQSLC